MKRSVCKYTQPPRSPPPSPRTHPPTHPPLPSPTPPPPTPPLPHRDKTNEQQPAHLKQRGPTTHTTHAKPQQNRPIEHLRDHRGAGSCREAPTPPAPAPSHSAVPHTKAASRARPHLLAAPNPHTMDATDGITPAVSTTSGGSVLMEGAAQRRGADGVLMGWWFLLMGF